jgi:hypothetical protein
MRLSRQATDLSYKALGCGWWVSVSVVLRVAIIRRPSRINTPCGTSEQEPLSIERHLEHERTRVHASPPRHMQVPLEAIRTSVKLIA